MMRNFCLIVMFGAVATISPSPLDMTFASRSKSTLLSATQTSATAASSRSKPHLNLVMLGQTVAGKTALVSAITTVLAKSNRTIKPLEDKSIDMSTRPRNADVPMATKFVEFSTANRHFALADISSHRNWRVEMITRAVQADAAILVVSGVEGLSAETRELLRIARLYGLSHVAVFLDEMDRVADERQAATREGEVRDLLNRNGFERDAAPIIPGSAVGAANMDTRWIGGVEELLEFLDARVPLPPRSIDKPFLMPIEEVFSIAGRGIVVTGRVERGQIRVGQAVDIIGSTLKPGVTILGVEMFRKPMREAIEGDDVGLLLESVSRQEVERGHVLTAPGSMRTGKRFRAEVYLLTREEGGRQTPVLSGDRRQFLFWTTDVTGTVARIEDSEIAHPGTVVTVEVELSRDLAMEQGARFAIRERGRRVGMGFVTQVLSFGPE